MIVAVACALIASSAGSAAAQERDEPILDALRAALRHDGLTIGALFQTVFEPSLDPDDGAADRVRVSQMRLRLRGALDGGFEYQLQTNFTSAPALLDAWVGWTRGPELGIRAGRFKTPFSREFLTFAGDLDLQYRARVVSELVPGRQMGVQIHGSAGEGARWMLGGFTGPDASPANEDLIGVARFEVTPTLETEDATLSIGVSAATGRDRAVSGSVLPGSYRGDGMLVGIDGRLEFGTAMLAVEAINADYDPRLAPSLDAAGLSATGGFMVSDDEQVLLRWDRYRSTTQATNDVVVLGFNSRPTSAAWFRVNWIVPIDQPTAPHRGVASLQIVF